jgi:hypothetical protein
MRISLITLVFISRLLLANDYDGPLTAGIEKFTCGEYTVKGQLIQKDLRPTQKKYQRKKYFIKLYPKTTREFLVPITGKNLSIYHMKNDPINISITATVIREGKGPKAKLKLTKFNKVVTEDDVMKFSVRKIKSQKCEV